MGHGRQTLRCRVPWEQSQGFESKEQRDPLAAWTGKYFRTNIFIVCGGGSLVAPCVLVWSCRLGARTSCGDAPCMRAGKEICIPGPVEPTTVLAGRSPAPAHPTGRDPCPGLTRGAGRWRRCVHAVDLALPANRLSHNHPRGGGGMKASTVTVNFFLLILMAFLFSSFVSFLITSFSSVIVHFPHPVQQV